MKNFCDPELSVEKGLLTSGECLKQNTIDFKLRDSKATQFNFQRKNTTQTETKREKNLQSAYPKPFIQLTISSSAKHSLNETTKLNGSRSLEQELIQP